MTRFFITILFKNEQYFKWYLKKFSYSGTIEKIYLKQNIYKLNTLTPV